MNTKTFLKTANKILYDRYIGIVMECVEMNTVVCTVQQTLNFLTKCYQALHYIFWPYYDIAWLSLSDFQLSFKLITPCD